MNRSQGPYQSARNCRAELAADHGCCFLGRYRDHRWCPQSALADLAVAVFCRGVKLEDLQKHLISAPGMQGERPMTIGTLYLHVQQALDMAGGGWPLAVPLRAV